MLIRFIKTILSKTFGLSDLKLNTKIVYENVNHSLIVTIFIQKSEDSVNIFWKTV